MDSTAVTTAASVISGVVGSLWGRAKAALRAEDAISDQPKLRTEFEAHKVDDLAHKAETRECLTEIRGELRRMNDNVDWIKRELDQRKEK